MFIEFNTANGKITLLKNIILYIFEKSNGLDNTPQDVPLLVLSNGQFIALSEDYQVAVDRWMNS